MSSKSLVMPFKRQLTPLLLGLATLAILGFLYASWQLTRRAMEEERGAMLYSLTLRAQSLGWAVEAAARLHRGSLGEVLRELGRQPGIAYIALVGKDGRIEIDSNPAVEGQILYTPQELATLNPGPEIQGRFTPDDENIFETWKIYHPAHQGGRRHQAPLALFIGQDAANFQKDLSTYETRLLLEAALLLLLLLSAAALAWLAFNYRLSRRRLADSRALAEQIIQSYPSPLLVTNLGGEIKFANRQARDFFAMQGNENLAALPGLPWGQLLADLRQGKAVFEQEMNCPMTGGGERPVSISDALVRDRHQQPVGCLFILRDLLEIKNLQRQLAESQRLAALGHMAAGIAHEIRNPLSSIRGYAGYLRQRLGDNAWAATTASLLEEEAIRLDRALSDLLLLSKKPQLKCQLTSLGALLRRLQLLLEPDTQAKNIHFHLRLPQEELSLNIDGDRLLQTLLNIALNAVEATPAGGEIRVILEKDGAKGCLISIRDNGMGIAAENLGQIFNPYFTTRAEGTGLGLTLARQIVEAHGGRIDVASEPGHGTVFTIHLPEDVPCAR